MLYERKFYRCAHCGNIISYLYESGVDVMCCGEEMGEIKPNVTDGAKEKHVPVAARDGAKLTVTIGSAAHPMTDGHHIAWITVTGKDRTQRVALSPTGEPSAVFHVDEGEVTVYAYCNLHGLWAADL